MKYAVVAVGVVYLPSIEVGEKIDGNSPHRIPRFETTFGRKVFVTL